MSPMGSFVGVLVGSLTPARAQDTVYWDFDAAVPSYYADPRAFLTPSPFPYSGDALGLRVQRYVVSFDRVDGAWLEPGDWVITHTSMALDLAYDADGYSTPIDVGVDVETAGPESHGGGVVGAFPAFDTTATCGLPATLVVAAGAPAFMSYAPSGTLLIDNIRGTGPVCAGFTDGDADGLCPEGVDLDADGTCVGAGELTPGEPKDCDDAALGPRCLAIAVSDPVPGGRFEATVTGAQPGERIRVLWSLAGGVSCPPELGGVCVDLDQARPFGGATADAAGAAIIARTLSATAPPGTTRWFAAVVARPGFTSDTSPAVAVTVP